MRNKKLSILIAIILLVVFITTMSLAACKKRDKDKDNIESGEEIESGDDDWNGGGGGSETPITPKPPQQAKDFKNAMEYMVKSLPSEFMSFALGGKVTARGKRYDMSVKGNISDGSMQVALVFNPEGSSNIEFATYIVNSKVFVMTSDGVLYDIAGIDVDYLVSIMDKVPDLVSNAIGDLLKDYGALIDFGLGLLLNGFAPTNKMVYTAENGVEKFAFDINVQGFLQPIGTIINMFIPKDALGNIDLSFVSDLINAVPLINGTINATVTNSTLSEFAVELLDNNPQSPTYTQPLLGFNSAITFSNTPIELDIPENLDTYQSLTLGNLNADFTLTLDTDGKPFDIGKLVDEMLVALVPSITQPIFGGGVLTLDGNAQYTLDVKAALDANLDGRKEDNNYLNVVFKSGENELARINYLDGKLYIKALGNGVNGFAQGGINIAVPLDLKGYISQLVNLVTDAIDNALGTQFKPELTAGTIVSSSVSRSGDVILSPSIQTALVKILGIVGLEKYVIPSGDRITVLINNEFLKAITDLAKVDPIELPIFGDLTIGLFGGGIEYVELKAMDVLTLRADNFLIGKAKITRKDILDSIGNIDGYGENIEKIIKTFALSLLSDLDVSLNLDVSTVDTTVNLTPIINNIMAVANSSTYLKMPITLDLSNYDGIFKVRIATSYLNEGEDVGEVGRIMLEVVTPDGDTLIGLYNEKSSTYVDLSGLGFMKFCLTNVNLFDAIRGMLLDSDLNEENMKQAVATVNLSNASGVEISSDSIGVAVNNYLFTLMLRMLGMDLGLDIDLDAQLNFDGSIDLNLALGETAKLGLEMSLGKESESGNRIAEAINELPKGEFGEYNAVDANMLVDSILVAQNLNLTVDLYNNNIDYPSHENKTRIVIRKSAAQAMGQTETLPNGMQAPYKSLVLMVYADWTTKPSEALLYAYVDFDNKKLQLKGTERMLSVDLLVYKLTGDVLDIPIENVDIKGILVDALSGLFGDASDNNEDFGGAIEIPDGALPDQKPTVTPAEPTDPTAPSDPATPSEGEQTPPIDEILPGINITLNGVMDIDVDVDINGAYISKVLKDLISGILTDLDLTSMGIDGLVTVNYDNESKDVFFNDLYSKIILPIIQKQVANATIDFLGDIVALIAKNEGIKNQVHELVQRFLPLPNIEDLSVNVSLDDGKLSTITAIGSNPGGNDAQGFGIYIFNKKAELTVSWGNQATDIYFNPTFGTNLADMFETRARRHTADNWEVDSWQDIVWTLKDGSADLATFSSNISSYPDGQYVFTGRAWNRTIEVKVTLHNSPIVSVKDMQVKAMRGLPNYVYAVFADGSERMLTNVEINCESRNNVQNNASITVNEDTFEFTITFEGEELSLDTLTLNAYDYLDKIEALEKSGVAKVKVNGTFYRNLPATYDFSAIKAMTRQELQKPNVYDVNVHVGAGTPYESDLTLKVEFTPFDIYYIKSGGLNYIETDYIKYTSGVSFPSEITVVGYNGKEKLEYTAKVSKWNLESLTVDLKGGQYFVSAILNEGEYNEWRMEGIEVDVLSTDIVDLAPNSKSVVFDWKYFFYGGATLEQVMPSMLDFTTSDGLIKKNVPVTIDISQFFADQELINKAIAEGITIQCPVSVDAQNDGKSLLETTVSVVIPSIKMSLIEDEITVDYEEYSKYGNSIYFRDKIDIMLGSDKVEAKVTWYLDNVTFNRNGEYQAIVYINRGKDYVQSCIVTVRVTGAPTAEGV